MVTLKSRDFPTHRELALFAQMAENNVTTIVSIVFDATSGKFVLFWT